MASQRGHWTFGLLLVLKLFALGALLSLEIWKLAYFYPEQKRQRKLHSEQMERLERQR